jgi:hypothetical protein
MNENLESDLKQFTGTDEYHRWSVLFPNILLTDGAKYLAEKAGAYWLMDLIGSWQQNITGTDFQVWRLTKTGDKAVVVCDNGNGYILARQHISYTDFPLDEVNLYAVQGMGDLVIMLPGEY